MLFSWFVLLLLVRFGVGLVLLGVFDFLFACLFFGLCVRFSLGLVCVVCCLLVNCLVLFGGVCFVFAFVVVLQLLSFDLFDFFLCLGCWLCYCCCFDALSLGGFTVWFCCWAIYLSLIICVFVDFGCGFAFGVCFEFVVAFGVLFLCV